MLLSFWGLKDIINKMNKTLFSLALASIRGTLKKLWLEPLFKMFALLLTHTCIGQYKMETGYKMQTADWVQNADYCQYRLLRCSGNLVFNFDTIVFKQIKINYQKCC